MKKLIILASALSLLLVFIFSCAPGAGPVPPTGAPALPAASKPSGEAALADWQKKWEATLSAARQEGEVLVYLNAPSEARVALPEAFSKKFGLKLDLVMGSAAVLNTRLNSEYRAGIFQADAILAGASAIWSTVKPQGVLALAEPMLLLPEVREPAVWIRGGLPFFDKDRMVMYYLSVANPPVVYNSGLVKEGQITSYLDLLKPEWKGKLVMYDPTIAGGGQFGAARLSLQWGVEKANEYFRSLIRQEEIVITRDQRQQMEWVARGKYPVALWPNSPGTIELLQAGAPITPIHLKENIGVSASAGGLAIPAKTPHPNAAIVFLNWFLSREGQTLAVKTMGAPSARTDVPVEGIAAIFLAKPADRVFLQDEEFTTEQNKLIEGFKRVFSPGG